MPRGMCVDVLSDEEFAEECAREREAVLYAANPSLFVIQV